VSVRVQALPSSHDVPSGLAGVEHRPVAVSQTPATWHWSGAAHTTGVVPMHTPAWQASVRVQALPSSHPVPSAFVGLEHTPETGSQTPAAWH
jgi:hypothetical protein